MKKEFDINEVKGLSQQEAIKRLELEGYNELPLHRKQSIFSILFNVIREPMLFLLIGSGLIYLLLGETKDALMLLSFIFVVVGITFYQERKTERALESLKNLSSPRALVIRDGQQIRIAGRDVVLDDILILNEGDRVPADAVVLQAVNLSIDESLLTGESLSVRKSEWDGKLGSRRPGGDDLPFVYSGTLVVSGRGVAKVTAIGIHTEFGKIGRALQTIRIEDTLLKREIGRLVRNFTIVGIALCLVIVAIYGISKGNWLDGFLAGLTFSMAMLPEEFSVVLLIFLTLGAWRISKRNVLTRVTSAIETLGAATVLCVDKTGTLTLNRMMLDTLYSAGSSYQVGSGNGKKIPRRLHNLLEYGILASQKDPFDPIEKEIKNRGKELLANTEHIHRNWKLIREYPLSKQLLALSHVWESPDKKNYIIAAKGAPEAIADLCHFTRIQQEDLRTQIQIMASRGLRLIGVAKASFNKKVLPDKQHDFPFEFIGLFGFIDSVRSMVPSSLKEAYTAGIHVVMITGDYPGTALYIAKKIGLSNPDKYITGPEIEKMDIKELREKIKHVNIFARVVPEQKLTIVNALKANGEIVAMTGDGVNDAPALKSAHIGIAMGERGTDVARESAALVLLNDDFSSIVSAVKLGRRIYDNLKKAMSYILAVHVPIAGMSLFPVLFNLPVVLLPAHIAFLELIIDPACSVVFEVEPEEHDIMNRPPRNLKKPMFDKRTFIFSFLQGLSVLAVVFIVFLFTLHLGKGELEARTLTFTTLVFANLVLILTNLSWSRTLIKTFTTNNRVLWCVLGGALLMLSVILYVPILRNLFHFTMLHPDDFLITLISGIVSVVWFEALKILNSQRKLKILG